MSPKPLASVPEMVDLFARADRLASALEAEAAPPARLHGARAHRDHVARAIADQVGPGVLLARRGRVYLTSAEAPRLASATWRDLDDEEYRSSVVEPLATVSRIAAGEPVERSELASLAELILLNTDAMPEEVPGVVAGIRGAHPPADMAAMNATLDQALADHRARHGKPLDSILSQAFLAPEPESLAEEVASWLEA